MSGCRKWLYLVISLLFATTLIAQVRLQVIQGEELEQFLLQARIVGAKDIGQGVTLPKKLTLELNGVTRFGVFKSIDQSRPVMAFERGGVEMGFQDTWKTEIAAYEVDKIIGLGMVPATVERTHDRQRGSVQIWIDSMMAEAERLDKKMAPPDALKWNLTSQKTRLFDNLIYNTDRHLNNVLISKEWEVILIDHSRAFRIFENLKEPKSLTRFSRSLLEGLPRLNKQNLTERVGKYLSQGQIEALLKRRDLILAQARKMAAEQGEARVLYP